MREGEDNISIHGACGDRSLSAEKHVQSTALPIPAQTLKNYVQQSHSVNDRSISIPYLYSSTLESVSRPRQPPQAHKDSSEVDVATSPLSSLSPGVLSPSGESPRKWRRRLHPTLAAPIDSAQRRLEYFCIGLAGSVSNAVRRNWLALDGDRTNARNAMVSRAS